MNHPQDATRCPSCRCAAPGGRCPECRAFHDGTRWNVSATAATRNDDHDEGDDDMAGREFDTKNYRYCPTCDELFNVKRIRTKEKLWSDDVEGEVCPDGHAVEAVKA